MIQRKQTLFLLLALVFSIVCLSFPLGSFEPKGMGVSPILFNLGLKNADGALDFNTCLLFILLLFSSVVSIVTIFLYRWRKLQAKLCWCNVALDIFWYAYLGYCVFNEMAVVSGTFHPSFTICLPFVAIILYFMAYQGIMKDERLVRSADRIR